MPKARMDKQLLIKVAIGVFFAFLPLIIFAVPLFKGYEMLLIDYMQKFRGPRPHHAEIILVTVDDKTYTELEALGFRQYCAEVIADLNRYGAKTIAFNFVLESAGTNPAANLLLANATVEKNNVIHSFSFGYNYDPNEKERADTTGQHRHAQYAFHPQNLANFAFTRGDSLELPNPFFFSRFKKVGFANLFKEADGRTRYFPLMMAHRSLIYPAMSLVALCEYLEIPLDRVRVKQSFWGYRLELHTKHQTFTVPINAKGELLLNHYGNIRAFKAYSVLQIRQALQELVAGIAPQVLFHDFKNKLVVMGTVETNFRLFTTAFSPVFPGVGLQATAISNILNNEALRQWPWYVDAGIIILLGALLMTGTAFIGKVYKGQEGLYEWLCLAVTILAFNLMAYLVLFKIWHVAPALLQINGAVVLMFIATSFYEKNIRVKILEREVAHLDNEVTNKSLQIESLNTKIDSQSEQHKMAEFFIHEMEGILEHPAMEKPELLETPLVKMQIIKEQLKNELEQRRAEKEILEIEKEALHKQVEVYQGVSPPDIHNSKAPSALILSQQKFDLMKRVLEKYKKSKGRFHLDETVGMVTCGVDEHDPHENHKTPEVFAQIQRFGAHDVTVLITGETGTGKELVAQAIRLNSSRKAKPFVVLNCAAIPETLMESELFGHVRGAFTNAISDHPGAFEQAHGGTIFLDEIGELKPDLQGKLLRVLQDKKIQRLGDTKTKTVDVRIIAATNRDLQKLMQLKLFRDDLYFRLDVANIHLLPLRERREEIPPLIHYFLEHFHQKHQSPAQINDEALMALILYDWPGNIRELQNLIEKVGLNTVGETIRLDDLPEKLQQVYRDILVHQEIPMWDVVTKATKDEMARVLARCQEMIAAGNGEAALQTRPFHLLGETYANCYDYMKTYVDSKSSLFPLDQREKLAKQTIVTLAEQLTQWWRVEKRGPMNHVWADIEILMGRTRRQIDNWKHELGMLS